MRSLLLLLLIASSAVAGETVKVTAQPFAEIALYPQADAPAQVISLNQSSVAAEISARIIRISAEVGDAVQAGDTLAELDCGDYRLAEVQAHATIKGVGSRLDFASYRKNKAQSLAKSRSLSEEALKQRTSEVLALEAELGAAKAALSQARRNVQRCRLVSPFAAIVLSRQAQLGEQASPGKPLFQLLDHQSLEVVAQVPADLIDDLGQSAQPVLRIGQQDLPLSLRVSVAALDPGAGTREVRLSFKGVRALPGSSGRLLWRSVKPHVPANLLEQREGKLGVFVFNRGTAKFHRLGAAQQGRPVPNDLPLSTQLIIDGRVNLQDGDAVKTDP